MGEESEVWRRDREERVKLDNQQFERLITRSEELLKLNEELVKWVSDAATAIPEAITEGFAALVAALKPQPPPIAVKPRGTIMADFSIPDDTPDGRVTFNISANDAEGQPITDPAKLAALSFEALSSDLNVVTVALDADQPDPTKRVGGYHVGAPGQAAITSNLKNDKGDIVATGTDGFTVTTGAVAIGSVTSNFEGLTPIA